MYPLLRPLCNKHSKTSFEKTSLHDKEQPSDEPQRDEFESLKPKKSNWTPLDGQFTSVDLFVKKCRVVIQKLNFNKSLKFSNLSKEE